jgi:hypothetical protein
MAATTVGDRLKMLVRSLSMTHGDFAKKKWYFAEFHESIYQQ